MARRVLACTIGSTPQIVTETVWSLHRQEGWAPDEIEVLTTAFKADLIHRELILPEGHLARMPSGPPLARMFIPTRGGRCDVTEPGALAPTVSPDALADVYDQAQALAMGEMIMQRIAHWALDPDADLHVSIGGGYKTMSAQALTALALAGRPGHRASHVLVDANFQNNPFFFHPDQEGGPIPLDPREPDGVRVDPKFAKVVLVDLPVVFAPAPIEAKLLRERGFTTLVEEANAYAAFEREPHVGFDIEANTVTVGGRSVRLSAKKFAILRLSVEARKNLWGHRPGYGAGWMNYQTLAEGTDAAGVPLGVIFERFVSKAAEVSSNKNDSALKDKIKEIRAMKHAAGAFAVFTNHTKSKLKEDLAKKFGPWLARRLLMDEDGWFGCTAPSNAIEIR